MTRSDYVNARISPEPNTGCWLWSGAILRSGYGSITIDNRTRMAHRHVYEMVVGKIPSGLCIDHLCRVRSCVNPDHLEPVTTAENLRRSPLVLKWREEMKKSIRWGREEKTDWRRSPAHLT